MLMLWCCHQWFFSCSSSVFAFDTTWNSLAGSKVTGPQAWTEPSLPSSSLFPLEGDKTPYEYPLINLSFYLQHLPVCRNCIAFYCCTGRRNLSQEEELFIFYFLHFGFFFCVGHWSRVILYRELQRPSEPSRRTVTYTQPCDSVLLLSLLFGKSELGLG